MGDNNEVEKNNSQSHNNNMQQYEIHHQLYSHIVSSSAWKGMRRWVTATVILLFFLITAAVFISWVDLSGMFGIPNNTILTPSTIPYPPTIPKRPLIPRIPKNNTIEYPLNCTSESAPRNCTTNYPQKFEPNKESVAETCPDYFKWIYEDLKPWKETGITRDDIERAKKLAHFRLAVVGGIPYMEIYHGAFQTRELFTIWGLAQLFRMYPGKVPDLELMFRLEDRPAIQKHDYPQHGSDAKSPPVLFGYCGHDDAVGIISPDWSYWGWVETNIKPWNTVVEDIIEGSNKTKWEDREPYAYWKGNQYTSHNRGDLMKCNVSRKHDWNARLYQQDWVKETQQGFHNSNLEDQCIHRYKIYVEGVGWSVSDKYILGCDAMTLIINPQYYDFFLRSLVPLQHYWPITPNNLCKDIKFAVDWGNHNPHKAKAIGKSGSDYVRENLKMEYIYAYMFHLLSEYAKLLKFKPQIPEGAHRLCAENVACHESDLNLKYLKESMVMSPSDTPPCSMPPPFNPADLQLFFSGKDEVTKLVEQWVREGYSF